MGSLDRSKQRVGGMNVYERLDERVVAPVYNGGRLSDT